MNLTFAKFNELLEKFDKLPPIPFLASSVYLPDKAFQFKEGDRLYVGGSPAFWSQLPPGRNGPPGFGGITIWDLDIEGSTHRKEFFNALERVMSAGYCKRGAGCVCGGDLPSIRACCQEWVLNRVLGCQE